MKKNWYIKINDKIVDCVYVKDAWEAMGEAKKKFPNTGFMSLGVEKV